MKKLIYFILIAFSVPTLNAQQKKAGLPIVGKRCPEFKLTDVQYYSKKQVTLDDFKGQWLILDFWNLTCVNCLKAMPKMSMIQSAYKDSVKIIMVGYTGSQYRQMTKIPDNKPIRTLFEKNRKAHNLNLTVAYDSTLFHQFDIGGCPYIVVVNPQGVVKAITTRIEKTQLDSLRRNQDVHVKKAYNRTELREARLMENKE